MFNLTNNLTGPSFDCENKFKSKIQYRHLKKQKGKINSLNTETLHQH